MTTLPRGDDEPVVNEWVDTSEDPVALGIVRTAARALGRDPVEMPPLFPHVDPDAIETLFASGDRVAITLSFLYDGLVVRIHGVGDGAVRIEARTAGGSVASTSATNGTTSRDPGRREDGDGPSHEG